MALRICRLCPTERTTWSYRSYHQNQPPQDPDDSLARQQPRHVHRVTFTGVGIHHVPRGSRIEATCAAEHTQLRRWLTRHVDLVAQCILDVQHLDQRQDDYKEWGCEQ